MKREGHQQAYSAAYDTASSELNELSEALEQLRMRKDHIERLVSVLRPLLEFEETGFAANREAEANASEEPAVAAQSSPSEPGEKEQPDPFQRRVDHVLGIGAGIRNVRKYTRQF